MIEVILFLFPAVFSTGLLDFLNREKSTIFIFIKRSILFSLFINILMWITMIIVFDEDMLKLNLDNFHSIFFSLLYSLSSLGYSILLAFVAFILKKYVNTIVISKKNKK